MVRNIGVLRPEGKMAQKGISAVNQCGQTTKYFEVIPGISTMIKALETLYNPGWRGNAQ